MRFIKYMTVGIFVVSILSFLITPSIADQHKERVSEKRIEKLSRGINVPRWLWLGPDDVPPLEERLTNNDLAKIKALGLKHIRIPCEFVRMYDENAKNLLNAKHIQLLDKGIERILDKGLAVIVDLHSIGLEGGSDYSGPLASDPEFLNTFIDFWSQFAKHLSKHDTDWVFLEPMNEPVFRNNVDTWPPMQKKIVAAIRKQAPEHTIFATSAHWSNLETFLKLQPLDDDNIVYNFHFYEPFPFTHQGASWTSSTVQPMRQVPYPSSPQAVEESIELTDNDEADKRIRQYGKERWNGDTISNRIAQAGEWANKYNVPVTCNEFGVYKRYSILEDRAKWHHDLRTALEENGIGWTKWELDGGFGLFSREDGKLIVEEKTAKGLGLDASAEVLKN